MSTSGSVFTQPEESFYEPIERHRGAEQFTRHPDIDKGKPERSNSNAKSRPAHTYENIPGRYPLSNRNDKPTKRSPLSRNDTYLVRRSALDLHIPSYHNVTPVSLDRSKRVYQSCQSLGHSHSSIASQRYPWAPQKVTTLTSPDTSYVPSSLSHNGSSNFKVSIFSILKLRVDCTCNRLVATAFGKKSAVTIQSQERSVIGDNKI